MREKIPNKVVGCVVCKRQWITRAWGKVAQTGRPTDRDWSELTTEPLKSVTGAGAIGKVEAPHGRDRKICRRDAVSRNQPRAGLQQTFHQPYRELGTSYSPSPEATGLDWPVTLMPSGPWVSAVDDKVKGADICRPIRGPSVENNCRNRKVVPNRGVGPQLQ